MSAESATVRDRARPAPAPTSASPAPRGLVQRRCACGGKPGVGGECAECRKKRLGVQAKLRVGRPGDRWEREADAAAERMLAAPAPLSVGQPPSVQRSAVVGGAGRQLGLGAGRPLAEPVRRRLEAGAGRDFSAVRVHTGERADELARGFSARAFTLGGDVAFARGELRPASRDGLRLLAHELTHTAQQGASPALPAASPMAVAGAPPGTVQREVDCTTEAPRFNCPTLPEDRQAVIEERRGWALGKVAHAAAVLESGEAETLNPRTVPAFEAFFGPYEPARTTDVAARLRRVESSIFAFRQPGVDPTSPFPLRCANECEPTCRGTAAFFDPSDPSIQFCDGYFAKEEVGQKATFVHEAVHATLGSGDAEIYSSRRLFARLSSEPADDPQASSLAAQNPDSYAGFVLAVSGLPLAEAQTLKGELPSDRYAGFDDEAEEAAARRAVAYAEMVVRTAKRDVDKLGAALALMLAGETWADAVQRLGVDYQRDTLHLLRGTPIDASGSLPADRNTTCRAPSRFSIDCPEDGRTRQDEDLSTVEQIGVQLGRVEKLFTDQERLLVRRGARGLRGGEEADFRFRALLQRDRLRLSDSFFTLEPKAQALAVVDTVVRGFELPTPESYLIFLRRTTQRSELRALPIF